MALSRSGFASLAFLGGALVFGVVLGLVLAFGASEPDPWEERWSELGVPEAEFVFMGNFTDEEQKSIRRELKAAQVVFAEHFGAVTSAFTVYVSKELDALNERLVEFNGEKIRFTCGGRAFAGAVFLTLEGCARELRLFGGPLAHEYFHILQYEAGDLRSLVRGRLGWTVEGSAEYAHALVSDARGRISLDVRREGLLLSLAAGARHVQDDPYDIGFLAMDWLAEVAGSEAVLEFFRLGGDQAAFESAFGISALSFSSSFAAYGRVVAPPFEWRVGGTVLGSDGAPLKRTQVYALVRIEGDAWTAGNSETDAQGEFEFAAPGSGYTLGLWLKCPRDDGVEEWIHAGQWGEGGFVVDTDGLFDSVSVYRGKPFTDGDRDRTDLLIRLPTTLAELTEKHCQS